MNVMSIGSCQNSGSVNFKGSIKTKKAFREAARALIEETNKNPDLITTFRYKYSGLAEKLASTIQSARGIKNFAQKTDRTLLTTLQGLAERGEKLKNFRGGGSPIEIKPNYLPQELDFAI